MPLTIKPLTTALGAEVEGVDLGAGLEDDDVFDEVHRAFLAHQVLFFRDQKLTPEAQAGLARRFGPPIVHPMMQSLAGYPEILEVVKEPEDRNNFGGEWHTDLSFLERPPLGSMLYALEVPEVDGDTLFANMYLAYEALSEGMRALLGELRAVHGTAKVYHETAQEDGIIGNPDSMPQRQRNDEPEVSEHPVVRTHPQTGRKALYVNSSFTLRFSEMTEEESKPLLDYLLDHAARPEFTCRFRWSAGTLAFWDNRCAQHYALNDYPGQRRVMHRIAIEGDRPV